MGTCVPAARGTRSSHHSRPSRGSERLCSSTRAPAWPRGRFGGSRGTPSTVLRALHSSAKGQLPGLSLPRMDQGAGEVTTGCFAHPRPTVSTLGFGKRLRAHFPESQQTAVFCCQLLTSLQLPSGTNKGQEPGGLQPQRSLLSQLCSLEARSQGVSWAISL